MPPSKTSRNSPPGSTRYDLFNHSIVSSWGESLPLLSRGQWQSGGMNIVVYYKTGCPWAVEVMDFLDDHHLSFEERNITVDEESRQELMDKTGQIKSPTLDIDGQILSDTDVDA